jgi:hypothetical protein
MPNTPFGGSLDEQAQWANENINSNFGVEAWKAQGPMDSGCPPDYPYRSKRAGGDNACVEHPDNCPWGKTLHGSTCISWDQANSMFGGGYGPGAGASAPSAPAPANPLAGMMAGMPQIPQLAQPVDLQPGQGQPWGGRPQGLPQMLQPMQTMPSATQNLMTRAMSQAPSQVPQTLGTGWMGRETRPTDGLQKLMAKNQRKPFGQIANGQGGAWWA